MSGRPYTVNSDAMVAAAGAATTIGGLFSQMSAEVGGINVPPGVEGAPQAKLGVVSRRLAQVGRAVASQGPVLQNAAQWAAIFEAPSTGFHPLTFNGFPGAAPGLVTPFGNTDATNHRGNDWLAGVVSPLGELAELAPKAIKAVQNPAAWAMKNQKEIRFAITNTGKLGREAWRDAYASDAGDAGDRDYAWGQRTTTVLTLPIYYIRAAKAGATAIKAPGVAARARADVPIKLHARNTARDRPIDVDHTAEAHARSLAKAEASLSAAIKARRAADRNLVKAPWKAKRRIGGAIGVTVTTVGTPVSGNNIDDAYERQTDGK